MDIIKLHKLTLLVTVICFLHIKQTQQSRDENNVCPESCFCNRHSKIVYCSRRGLQRIPTESIPSNSLQLNLNGNIFQSSLIKRSNFSRFSLVEHLYMSECGIEKIEVDTFTDLRKLQWLDLSNNRIKLIEEYTFRGLTLMHLFLNGNRNINFRKDSFAGLATTGLYLHECSLTKLDLDEFVHLNQSLKNLWLNGNELTKINKKFQSLFTNLQHLRLGSNPFHCNCEMGWFKQMYDTNLDKFEGADPPSCLSPTKWKGKFINEMSAANFECQAPVFKNIDAVFKGTEGMLRCTASGDPSPKLFWIQPSGFTTPYKPPSNESVHFNQAVLNISTETTKHNDLSGSYFCVAVNEAGNMTFTFNVTWPSSGSSSVLTQGGQHRPDVTYKTIPAHINLGHPNINENDEDNEDYEDETDIQPSTAKPSDNNKNRQSDNLSTKPPTSGRDKTLNEDNTNPDKTKSSVSNTDDENGGSSNSINAAADTTSSNSDNNNNNNKMVKTQKLFTLTELIGAILGTFFCTLILCGIIFLLYFRRRRKNNHSPHHHPSSHMNIGSSLGRTGSGLNNKPSLQEVRFLNGMGSHTTQTYKYSDYFDTPGSIKR